MLQQYAIFPESKEYIKYKLADLRLYIKRIEEIKKENQNIIYRKAPKEYEEFWNAVNDIVICGDYDFSSFGMKPKSGIWFCIKMIKMYDFLLQDRDRFSGKLNVEKAKQFPITSLLDFHYRKARCIFHDDHSPSLHYYPRTNTVYCFVCHTFADSIKVYKTMHNCSFKQAVLKLQQ